jgi:hypothetical protein
LIIASKSPAETNATAQNTGAQYCRRRLLFCDGTVSRERFLPNKNYFLAE